MEQPSLKAMMQMMLISYPDQLHKHYRIAYHAKAILHVTREDGWGGSYLMQQVWYADDAIATGSLRNLLRTWWDKLVTVGPSYGYFVNAVKTWLITKEETPTKALDIFQDTQICITKEGKPHLGAALGTSSYIIEFVKAKVKNGSLKLEQLASIANTQPHAAFSALTHSLAADGFMWQELSPTLAIFYNHSKSFSGPNYPFANWPCSAL